MIKKVDAIVLWRFYLVWLFDCCYEFCWLWW